MYSIDGAKYGIDADVVVSKRGLLMKKSARLAQSVEHQTFKTSYLDGRHLRVKGSSPLLGLVFRLNITSRLNITGRGASRRSKI